MINLTKSAALGAGLMLLVACGGSGGDAATYVKYCKQTGDREDICRCRAKYLQKNTTKTDYHHYIKTISEFDGLAPEEAVTKLFTISLSDPIFARVVQKEEPAQAACVRN